MVYTRDEIEAYTRRNLHIHKGIPDESVEGIYQGFIEMVEAMPPWRQVLMIESGGANMIADQDGVGELSRALDGDERGSRPLGLFFPYIHRGEALSEHFKRAATGLIHSSVVYQHDTEHGLSVFHHEVGHREDKLLHNRYFSDNNQTWNDALEREMLIRRSNPFARETPLYQGYRPLEEHLQFYRPSDHAVEAMAEMSNHYNNLLAQHGGDNTRVNDVLTKRYPELWPEYRDNVLPRLQTLADTLTEQRHKNIDAYVEQQIAYDNIMDRATNIEETHGHARILAARGTIERDTENLLKETRLAADPVSHYVDASRDYEEGAAFSRRRLARREALTLGKKFGQSAPLQNSFDENQARLDAESILTRDGKEALIARVHELQAQTMDIRLGRMRPPASSPPAENIAARLG